ncbi:MAG: hypothetical protein H0W36_05600 [Gemmatimonadetes bacterium]|nr:hypothetical protein [Gemmatimonadota bacterium]
MFRRPVPCTRVILGLALGLALAAPALAGPPWISIEIPANPHNSATRDALLVVHVYHHDNAVGYRVTGTAEGLVNGKRQSVRLAIAPAGTAGLYAVARPRLPEGRWILVLTLEDGRSGATALVNLDGGGEVAAVRVPSDTSRDGWRIPRPVSRGEVDALLRQGGVATRDGAAEAGLGGHGGVAALLATAGAIGLVPVAIRRSSYRRRR